jgi:hypothetical protein
MNGKTNNNDKRIVKTLTGVYTFGIGDHVWFNNMWVGPVSGVITAFEETDDHKEYAEIHWDDGGTSGALLADGIYPDEESIIKANSIKNDKTVAAYKESIKDVSDLVRFMYNKAVCTAEEYTDWEARQAARERAKELLGIDLDA